MVDHLHDVGYPSHVLVEIVQSLLSETVTTQARPFSQVPIQPPSSNCPLTIQQINIKPFLDEFRTVGALWQGVFGFPLYCLDLPVVEDVEMYSVKLEPGWDSGLDKHIPPKYPGLILAIGSSKDFDPSPTTGMNHYHSLLLKNEPLPSTVSFIQSFDWNWETRRVTFLLEKKRADKFRTDTIDGNTADGSKIDENKIMEIALVNPLIWRTFSAISSWKDVEEVKGGVDGGWNKEYLQNGGPDSGWGRSLPEKEKKGWEEIPMMALNARMRWLNRVR